jgi:hypothetical protein
MDQLYGDLAESREVFWTALREAYVRFKKEHVQAPDELEALVRAAGIPPDLLSRKGRDLRLWPVENVPKLGSDQRLLWQFVALIYPARQGRQGKVSSYSFISSDHTQAFHNARGKLGRFWNASIPTTKIDYLVRKYKSAADQLVMPTSLEIALLQWTNDQGPGKTSLFELAKEMIHR